MLCGLTYFAYGFDVSAFIFVAKDVQELWNLTKLEYAIFPAVTSVPNWIGALTISVLSDHYGRVWPYFLTMAVIGVFGIADAFSPSYAVLIIIRCFASLGIGGVPVVTFATFIEFLPRKNRGKAVVLTSVLPAIGLSVASGLAWWLIPTYRKYGWRYFIIATMAPSLFAAAFRLLFYFQSPRYLIAKKKYRKAWKVFNTMAWMNGKDLSQYITEVEFVSTVATNAVGRAPFRSILLIFKRPYLRRTLCLMGLIVTEIAAYVGSSLFLPNELEKLHVDQYFAIFVAFVAQIPGILLMSIIIEWPYIGRLNSLRFFSAMATVFFFLLAFVQYNVSIPLFLILIYFSMMPILTLLYTYISESYPTNIRSVSTAFFYFLQGLAIIPSFFLSAYLTSLPYKWLYPTVWGSMFVVNFALALVLNYEPRQKKLLDIVN